jgi:energy-coupling factor transporter ATP-binding protein EcfA2
MQLKSMKYSQYDSKPKEWKLEGFTLEDINLIVGRNATGKSRTLSVISGLGQLLTSETPLVWITGHYEVRFDNKGKEIKYTLHYEDRKVLEEKLVIDGKNKLDRGSGGKGRIYAEKRGEYIEFQAPENQLACVTRRDNIQHPYFEDLYEWGKNLRYYRFGEKLGQEYLVPLKEKDSKNALDLKDPNQVVTIFLAGERAYGKKFIECIKSDMGKIGFEIEGIQVGLPSGLIVGLPIEHAGCLILKEKDLAAQTEQYEISQGMFRALSLIIHLNYSQLASIPSCILIDDIGEGLDFERSSSLIKLLVEKAKKSAVQLVMSTNDRFVMNNVPLEYWCVMQRISNVCKVYNYRNAKKQFEDFKLTGLSNFDFFTSGAFEE